MTNILLDVEYVDKLKERIKKLEQALKLAEPYIDTAQEYVRNEVNQALRGQLKD